METRKLILDGLEVAGLVPWDPTKYTKSPDGQLATSVMASESRKNIAAHVVNLMSPTEPDDNDDATMEGNRVMENVRFATRDPGTCATSANASGIYRCSAQYNRWTSAIATSEVSPYF
jgi:hypothetical protein